MMANIRLMVVPILIGLGAFLAACGDSSALPEIPDDEELALGQDVYTKNCSRCHLNNGGGGSGVQLNDGSVLASFPDEEPQKALISEGKGRMPAFGELSDEQLDAVVRYTREVLAEEK